MVRRLPVARQQRGRLHPARLRLRVRRSPDTGNPPRPTRAPCKPALRSRDPACPAASPARLVRFGFDKRIGALATRRARFHPVNDCADLVCPTGRHHARTCRTAGSGCQGGMVFVRIASRIIGANILDLPHSSDIANGRDPALLVTGRRTSPPAPAPRPSHRKSPHAAARLSRSGNLICVPLPVNTAPSQSARPASNIRSALPAR